MMECREDESAEKQPRLKAPNDKKFPTTSTRFQINLKFQYSMINTCRIKTLFGISNNPSLQYSNTPENGYENYFATILTEESHAGMEKNILCTLLS